MWVWKMGNMEALFTLGAGQDLVGLAGGIVAFSDW